MRVFSSLPPVSCPSVPRFPRPASLLVLLVGITLGACTTEEPRTDYAARVGDYYLTEEEVASSLQSLGANTDTAEARRQIIEQWVTRTLLLQEAERMNLKQKEEVQKMLQEQERSILVNALTNQIYEEAELAPSASEVQAYFERHREQLRLREPFVRVRYLATPQAADAETVRDRLRQADPATADSLWSALVQEHASAPDEALHLAETFYPESRLFARNPYVHDELTNLREGETAPVIEADSLYHVLHLVRRVPAGALPERAWVEDQIRRRLMMRARKQMYAREVQRLRNEAKARNELDVR